MPKPPVIERSEVYEAVLYLNAASKEVLKTIRNNPLGHVVLLKKHETSWQRIQSIVPEHTYIQDEAPEYWQLNEFGLVKTIFMRETKRWIIELTELGKHVANELNKR